jgi:hypothetical protein
MVTELCVSSIVKIYLIFTHSCDLKIITEKKVWKSDARQNCWLPIVQFTHYTLSTHIHYLHIYIIYTLYIIFNYAQLSIVSCDWRTAKWHTLLYLKSKNYLPFLTNVVLFVWDDVKYLDFTFLALNSVHDAICMVGKDSSWISRFRGLWF